MPILNSILDHEVIGPAILEGLAKGIQQGRQEGRQEGRLEGRQEGRQEARLEILSRQLGKRFGALPAWVEVQLADLPESKLDEIALRLFDATSLEDLFAKGDQR